MADEKIRKVRADRPPMPVFARLMLGLGVAQIVFSLVMHIWVSVASPVIFAAGTVALVSAAITVMSWHKTAAWRHTVRAASIAVPLIFVTIAVVLWGMAVSGNPEADFGYNFLFSFSLAMSFWQVINVLLLPTLTAAASFGGLFDRILLHVLSLFNALLVTFFVYVTASQVGCPVFLVEQPIVQLVYVLFTFVFAGLTFVPSLYNDPDHTLIARRK